MARKKNNGLSEEKRNIIGQLIEMYDIKTAQDIQEALKDLLGGTIQSMLEIELTTQMEAHEDEDPAYSDSRNGYKPKTLRSSMGEIPISVPQDRNSDFEPQIVPKYKKDITEIEGKIIGMLLRITVWLRCASLVWRAYSIRTAGVYSLHKNRGVQFGFGVCIENAHPASRGVQGCA